MRNTLYLLILSTFFACTHRNSALYKISENGKVGYVDLTGKVVIPAVYWAGSDFAEGVAAVRAAGLYGYIDRDSKYVIAPQYEFATAFDHGVAKVHKDGRNYYIDLKGREILSDQFVAVKMVSVERGIVQTVTGKMGLIDIQSGKLIIDTTHKDIRVTPAGKYIVTLNAFNTSSDALIDGNGKVLVPFGRYNKMYDFNEGYAVAYLYDHVANAEMFSAIDEKGKELFHLPAKEGFSVSGVETYHNGFIKVYLNNGGKGYYGYMNLKGELVMSDSAYQRGITEFSDGRAILYKSNDDYVVIDTNLQKVNLPSFKEISGFYNGNAIARTAANKDVIIDRDGNVIMQPKYNRLMRIENSNYFAFARPGGKHGIVGIVDLKGKELISGLKDFYDGDGFKNGALSVMLEGDKIVYVDSTGHIFWRKPVEDSSQLRPLI